MYADRDGNGEVRTNICTQTKPIEEAAADLLFLEGLSEPSSAARVYGVASYWEARLTGENEQFAEERQ